jgi:hypothetical protein
MQCLGMRLTPYPMGRLHTPVLPVPEAIRHAAFSQTSVTQRCKARYLSVTHYALPNSAVKILFLSNRQSDVFEEIDIHNVVSPQFVILCEFS